MGLMRSGGGGEGELAGHAQVNAEYGVVEEDEDPLSAASDGQKRVADELVGQVGGWGADNVGSVKGQTGHGLADKMGAEGTYNCFHFREFGHGTFP